MKSIAKLAFVVCLGSTASMVSRPAVAATAEQISARLDALEKENAALRARVNHLETSRTATPLRRNVESNPGLASMSRPPVADTLAIDRGYVVKAGRPGSPRFEVSGTLNFMQPGAGNLEYATLVTPLPAVTPSWANQSLTPGYTPSFDVGARYMAGEANDIAINWTHQTNTANASVFATPLQMIGPPFLIGPESGLYKIGQGNVQTAYDAINLDVGHTFCAECSFQLRAFGGVEIARIGQNLTGTASSPDGAAFMSNTTTSLFTGAGPRLGMKGQYALGDFQFIGEAGGAALIGPAQSRINFTTLSPALAALNNQSLTSPTATRVVPSIDAKLAVAYTFAPSNYGMLRVETGYRAAVYFDAVNQYALTSVPTGLTLPPNEIYLATAQHLQTNFTDQGPYLKASWLFW